MPKMSSEDSEHAASGVRRCEIRKIPKMASEDSEYAVSGFVDSENAENGVGKQARACGCTIASVAKTSDDPKNSR